MRPGNYAAELARDGFRPVVADAEPAMLRRATAKLGPGSCVAADAAALPFGDGSFGCATLISAFHLFGDKAGALRELRRVVRQGPVVTQAFTRENLLPLFSHEYFDHPIHEEVRETDAAPGRPPQRRAGPEGRTGDGAGSHVGPHDRVRRTSIDLPGEPRTGGEG
ncbi:MAG TPA: class I SAM-dependent methyltransferase [Actinomycetota bacterium]